MLANFCNCSVIWDFGGVISSSPFEAFARYEAALVNNDVATLEALFHDDGRTIRYGGGENLYGMDAIREFRRARRRNVPKPVAVFDLMTEQVIGRVGNLSESGMLLVATEPVIDDALYQLRFHLRDERGQDVPIDVGAHLVWSAAANTPGQAFAGLRFLTIDREPLERLRQWVNAGPEAE